MHVVSLNGLVPRRSHAGGTGALKPGPHLHSKGVLHYVRDPCILDLLPRREALPRDAAIQGLRPVPYVEKEEKKSQVRNFREMQKDSFLNRRATAVGVEVTRPPVSAFSHVSSSPCMALRSQAHSACAELHSGSGSHL